MISFIYLYLPKDLVGIIEQYLQPVFNKYRYKLVNDYSNHYVYEGYNFFTRFNIVNNYKKNYRFKISFNNGNRRIPFGKYKDKKLCSVYVELFDKKIPEVYDQTLNDDFVLIRKNRKPTPSVSLIPYYYYKYSLTFIRDDLVYLCSLSHKIPDDIVLFHNYIVNLERDCLIGINRILIDKFKFKETLLIWNKVWMDMCVHFCNLK